MAAVIATLIYFTLILTSFLAARKVVTARGLTGALGLVVCWLALASVFAYIPSIVPFVPLDQRPSFAVAQMVLVGSALGLPAGFVNRWRQRTKPPKRGS